VKRLTDEEMAGLQRITAGDDGVRPIMFPWIDRALAELRERRAADLSYQDRSELERLKRADVEQGRRIAALLAERLSDDEREALGDLHARIIANYDGTIESRQRAHVAVLDRLLQGGKR
jgi:tellurite resistance protein